MKKNILLVTFASLFSVEMYWHKIYQEHGNTLMIKRVHRKPLLKFIKVQIIPLQKSY